MKPNQQNTKNLDTMKRIALFILLFVVAISLKAQYSAIRIETQGEGSPVILLPGFTCPASVWDSTIVNLKGSYQYIKVTYAGFDGVPAVDMPWYPKLAADIQRYITDNQLTNITLIGHSMGGNLAIDIAASVGDRVSKMVLVDAIPCMRELMMPGVPASSLQYDSPYNNQMLQMPAEGFQQMAGGMATNMTSRTDKVKMLTSWILASDRKTYVYGFTDLLKQDLRDTLKSVTAKTLVVGASFPTAEQAKGVFEVQYANLSNKQITIAPANCRHFVMFDAADWFYNQLNTFLE